VATWLGYDFAERDIISKAADRFGADVAQLSHAVEERPSSRGSPDNTLPHAACLAPGRGPDPRTSEIYTRAAGASSDASSPPTRARRRRLDVAPRPLARLGRLVPLRLPSGCASLQIRPGCSRSYIPD